MPRPANFFSATEVTVSRRPARLGASEEPAEQRVAPHAWVDLTSHTLTQRLSSDDSRLASLTLMA